MTDEEIKAVVLLILRDIADRVNPGWERRKHPPPMEYCPPEIAYKRKLKGEK